MNFFIVGIIVVHQLPNKSTQIIAENKELKLIVANPISEKKIEQIVKLVPPKQEVVQKEAKPVPPKQEVVNQENAKSKSLIEKAVSYFSQYFLIGLVLADIVYIYFKTKKK
jgi:hypothetical protein